MRRFDLENEEAIAYVEATLLRARRAAARSSAKGFEPGDEVQIAGEALALFASGVVLISARAT